MDRKKLPSHFIGTLFFIAFGAVVLAAAWHFGTVISFVQTILGFLRPAIIGFVIAFILNVPMSAMEKLFARIQNKFNLKLRHRLNTILALILTLVLVAGILGLLIWGIVPYLVDSIHSAAVSVRNNYPHALDFLESHGISTHRIREIIDSFRVSQLLNQLENNINEILKISYSALSTFLSSVFVYFTAFILALYMLASKHRLKSQFNRLLDASVKPERAVKVRHVLCVAYRSFNNFIGGQCLEATILGILFFAVLTLSNIPYAFLISTLIAVTAIIPYVGAFIGFFIGAVMILMTDPIKALLFSIIFLALQQVEEHLIYPRVVGRSVGLPPVWTLFALLVGGQIGGILGMLIFIPLMSIIYTLTRQYVESKENRQTKNTDTDI